MELNSKLFVALKMEKIVVGSVFDCDGGIAQYRWDTHLGCSNAGSRNIDFTCYGCLFQANPAYLCWRIIIGFVEPL